MIWRAVVIFLLYFSILPEISLAADPLHYGSPISLRAKTAIETYLTGKLSPVQLAGTDLNNDSINEYIARDESCTPQQLDCRHIILADTDHGIVMLGDIKARTLLLGNVYSHGIRDLMAQDNPGNDYALRRYVWDPSASRYTISKEGSAPTDAP